MALTAKQKRIYTARASAPKVPGHTCPSIDYVQQVIDQISDRGDDWAVKQADLIKEVLEYIRESNDELRSSSHYWYKKYKGAA